MNNRIAIASITLSAASLISLVVSEGYTDKAVIPVPGDKPTIGFGTTDGVKMGDKIDPVTAVKRAYKDIQQFEGAVRQCVKVPLMQSEYDAWVEFTYNVGADAFCRSTAVKKLNAGDYAGACEQMKRWVYVAGQFNQGLANRREREYQKCMSEQLQHSS